MSTLDDLFLKYLHLIEPSEKSVARAASSHGPLREDLEKDERFGPFIIRTILSGSYGRGVSTFFIKDVDIILQTCFTLEYLRQNKHDDETEQECLLRLTQEAIRRTGRAASTRKRRRSIYVTLPEEINDKGETEAPELTLDIVPVLIQSDQDHDPMTIADKDLKGWFDTYPISQLEDSLRRNEKSAVICDRHGYKPLVKMFRAWKRVHFRTAKTPKGFILECLTARYHNPNAEHWVEAVHDLFKNICAEWPDPDHLSYIPEVPDLSNSAPRSIPIAKTVEEAKAVIAKIHTHLGLVEQAIKESESDLMKSAKTLQRVFGQDTDDVYFPLPEDDGDGGGSARKASPLILKSKSDVREAPQFG